jgi:Glyoxalase/Bleomycin resistance protein/Dioxygenase superfamily
MAEPQTKSAAKCKAICPTFIVPDVVASAEHYRDVLGFKILGYFLDPPVFAMVARDGAEIHFGKSDNDAPASPNVTRRKIGTDAYIWVDNLDVLWTELKARGAKIVEAPIMRVYKCYEMVVEDNFGFRLCFSMDFSQSEA